MMMSIPEAWSTIRTCRIRRRAFYQYHASLMEPWTAPPPWSSRTARSSGGTLDRNGLRPSRYVVTQDDLVVMASEVGVLDIPASEVESKGRLQPGRMFLVDTVQKCIVSE